MTIQAIPTRYKGYHFRSRLEARWAVFLDVLGVRWQYERQGYELPSGRYLPDFFLFFARGAVVPPWMPHNAEHPGVWLEIKGAQPSTREIALLKELQDGTGTLAYLLDGDPGECVVHIHTPSGAFYSTPRMDLSKNCHLPFLRLAATHAGAPGFTQGKVAEALFASRNARFSSAADYAGARA